MIAPEPSTIDAGRTTTDGEGREEACAVTPAGRSRRSEESPAATRLADAEEAAYLRELRERETHWQGYLD